MGWVLALFGMLYGSVNYMAGTVTANTMKSVMLMLGFNDQVGPNPEDEQITTTTINNNDKWTCYLLPSSAPAEEKN